MDSGQFSAVLRMEGTSVSDDVFADDLPDTDQIVASVVPLLELSFARDSSVPAPSAGPPFAIGGSALFGGAASNGSNGVGQGGGNGHEDETAVSNPGAMDVVGGDARRLPSGASLPIVPTEEKRKRNPAFLNTRPRFYDLHNDILLAEVWEALVRSQTEWLTARDIQALLEFCKHMQLGAKAPHRPPSGSIYYFDSRAGEYFRRDGYDYIKKKNSGISVREDHVKLRQGTVAVIYASYVHSAEWVDPVSGASLFHRRSYWHVDTEEQHRGVVVHYLGNQGNQIEPMQRAHEATCECVLCCLKRENSRPDRPGESLEQILSRAQRLLATTRNKKKRVSSVSSQSSSTAALAGGPALPPLPQPPSVADEASEMARKKKRRARSEDGGEADDEDTQMSGEGGASSDPIPTTTTTATTQQQQQGKPPRRSAAPNKPLIDGSSSDEEDVRRHSRPPPIATSGVVSHPAHQGSSNNNWFSSGHTNGGSALEQEDEEPSLDVLSPGVDDDLDGHALESLQGLLTPVHSRRHSEFDSMAASLENLFPPWSAASFGRPPAPTPTASSSAAAAAANGLALPSPMGQPNMVATEPPAQMTSVREQQAEEEAQKKIKKVRDPVTQKPATRFDFNNMHVAEVSPARLRERERTLLVIGMARLPETLNHRTWTEKVFPRVSIFFGEYRVPALVNVALGVVAFECPPLFRSRQQHTERADIIVKCEGKPTPIPFAEGAEAIWESAQLVGSDLKRPRPSFGTPIKSEAPEDGHRRATRSPVGGAHHHHSTFNNTGGDDEEEVADEEEDLDRRATSMVERVVRLMTSSGASNAQVAEIINEVSPDNGLNFLHTAVFCGASVQVVQMLLDHGADPLARTRDAEENSALHLACDQGNVAVARVLVKAGADRTALNAKGQSPFDAVMNREENESDAELFEVLGVQAPLSALALDGGAGQQSQQQPFSPVRLTVASPRPQTPMRAPSALAAALGDKDQHISLLRDALTSLSLQEQCALTIATTMNSEERKGRSASEASTSGADVAMNLGNAQQQQSEVGASAGHQLGAEALSGHGQDDLARVVSEAQPTLLAALSDMSSSERASLDKEARRIQSNVRAWLLRRQFLQVREAAKKMQALAKGHLARRHFRDLREKASATLVIQKSLRAHNKAKKARENQQQQQPSWTGAAAGGTPSSGLSGNQPNNSGAVVMRDLASNSSGTFPAAPLDDERRFSTAMHSLSGHPHNPVMAVSRELPEHPADSLIHSSEDLFEDEPHHQQ